MRLRSYLAVLAAFVSVSPALAAGQFGDWAAIVVAGDYRAHSGADSEVFDDARRDISADLIGMGFAPDNVMQFSVRPERYSAEQPRQSNPQTIATSLWDLSNRTTGGCFAYFTSHGNSDGIAMGNDFLSPAKMNQMISNACGDRPTVIVVSACFSGVFVPVLEAPNRLILTAARSDRTSFGCGEQFKYTYFDQCFIENLRRSGDFPDLAHNAQACIAAREKKENFKYASDPQLSIGADVAAKLPHWK
ncbi:MAG TPA: C13 family peptidase [Rhizomicrobium sp.]|jgi:hypothetical protein|nr:C13 family peptidase [Rhizomicrobium sp.]